MLDSEKFPGTENFSFLILTKRQEAWKASKHLWKYAGGDTPAKLLNIKAVQCDPESWLRSHQLLC